MDAGGGHEVFVPLSRAVVIMWLATEHMVAGHLDEARSKQIELLERVYSGIADMTQSRERVRAQMTALEEQLAKLEQQIGDARQFGPEDLAQEALTGLNSGQSQIAALKSQLDQLLAHRVKLTAAAQTLQAKIDGAGGTTAL